MHSVLAHLGATKTLAYLQEHVWWKDMVEDVCKYCKLCLTYARSKLPNQKPYRLLNPLCVPLRPWKVIGIDFIGPLPLSCNRDGEYDSITTVIDLLTAMVHLIPSHVNYTVKEITELVSAEVYKLHSVTFSSLTLYSDTPPSFPLSPFPSLLNPQQS